MECLGRCLWQFDEAIEVGEALGERFGSGLVAQTVVADVHNGREPRHVANLRPHGRRVPSMVVRRRSLNGGE